MGKNMHAIEFEATAYKHKLDLPKNISDGTQLRVLLLMDEKNSSNPIQKQIRRKPSPILKGTVIINGDLLEPISSEDDWDALK